jgi:hypothetical protein
MQPRAAGGVREVILQPVDDLDSHRVLQSPQACCSSASAEIPQKGLRYPGQLYGNPLHQYERNGGAWLEPPAMWSGSALKFGRARVSASRCTPLRGQRVTPVGCWLDEILSAQGPTLRSNSCPNSRERRANSVKFGRLAPS